MTPAEFQYRRVLRLLPAGYRQAWEEDMVSAYLDTVAESPRRSAGEWLSVAWLALRLRLNGSHVTPRAELWYHTVLGIAMLTTLYESLNATFVFADLVGATINVDVDVSWPNHVAYWWEALSLVWVATFICLVLGRLVAARVLVLVALAHEFGLTSMIVAHTLSPSWWGLPPSEHGNIHQAWLYLTAVTVFLIPKDFRSSRGWLAVYLAPAAVIVPIALLSSAERARWLPEYHPPPEWLQQLQWVNVGTLLHAGVIVGMVVALIRARRWLLPLAVFAGGVAAMQLLGNEYGNDVRYGWSPQGAEVWTWVNVGQLVLALACAATGFLAARSAWRAEGRSDTS